MTQNLKRKARRFNVSRQRVSFLFYVSAVSNHWIIICSTALAKLEVNSVQVLILKLCLVLLGWRTRPEAPVFNYVLPCRTEITVYTVIYMCVCVLPETVCV